MKDEIRMTGTAEIDGMIFCRTDDGFMDLVDYVGEPEELTVPEQVDGCPVRVRNRVFAGSRFLRRLVFERNVLLDGDSVFGKENIGPSWPFIHCDRLESVTLPDKIDRATDEYFPPFIDCPNLREVTFHPGCKNYMVWDDIVYKRNDFDSFTAVYCFSDEQDITVPGVVGGEPVTGVDLLAFDECRFLKHLTFGEGIVKLHRDLSFGVETVRLPNSYVNGQVGFFLSLRSGSFRRFLVNPDHPFYLEEDGFLYDRSGETLLFAPRENPVCRIREGVRKIGSFAFCCRNDLTEVILPDSLCEIERDAFCQCRGFRIDIPAGVEVALHAFPKEPTLPAWADSPTVEFEALAPPEYIFAGEDEYEFSDEYVNLDELEW